MIQLYIALLAVLYAYIEAIKWVWEVLHHVGITP
jgi:hypothetical protein